MCLETFVIIVIHVHVKPASITDGFGCLGLVLGYGAAGDHSGLWAPGTVTIAVDLEEAHGLGQTLSQSSKFF